jgi:hypothetical protein
MTAAASCNQIWSFHQQESNPPNKIHCLKLGRIGVLEFRKMQVHN